MGFHHFPSLLCLLAFFLFLFNVRMRHFSLHFASLISRLGA